MPLGGNTQGGPTIPDIAVMLLYNAAGSLILDDDVRQAARLSAFNSNEKP